MPPPLTGPLALTAGDGGALLAARLAGGNENHGRGQRFHGVVNCPSQKDDGHQEYSDRGPRQFGTSPDR
jgi:hypothetical protein